MIKLGLFGGSRTSYIECLDHAGSQESIERLADGRLPNGRQIVWAEMPATRLTRSLAAGTSGTNALSCVSTCVSLKSLSKIFVASLETGELTGIQTKPAAQEAYETWRLLIEYAKLSAVARGMDDPVRRSFNREWAKRSVQTLTGSRVLLIWKQ